MLITTANLDAAFTGFKGLYNQGLESAPSYYKQISMIVPSGTSEQEYSWLGQFPKMREWLGPRTVKNLVLHGFAIKNRTFETTISIRREKFEDDQYGTFGPMFAEMGKAAGELPDTLIFELLKGGFTGLCYDGQNFFDTDHPVWPNGYGVGDAVSVSNMVDGGGTAWFLLDTSRAIRPLIYQERRPYVLVRKDRPEDDNVFLNREFIYGTDGRSNAGYGLWQLAYASKADLTAANYEAARQAMMSLKGDEGRPLNVKPDTLVVPPTLEGAAMRLLNNGTRIETVAGVPVALQNEWKDTAKPIVTTWVAP